MVAKKFSRCGSISEVRRAARGHPERAQDYRPRATPIDRRERLLRAERFCRTVSPERRLSVSTSAESSPTEKFLILQNRNRPSVKFYFYPAGTTVKFYFLRKSDAHLYRLVRELTPGNGSIERHTPPHDHLLLADWKSVCLVTLVIDRNRRLRLLRFYSRHASSFVVQLLRPPLRFGMASQDPTHQITVVRVRNGRTRRGPVAVVAASGRQGAPHPNGSKSSIMPPASS